MRSCYVECTIVNHTSGAIQYKTKTKSWGNCTIKVDAIPPGSSTVTFRAEGVPIWTSGCTGSVFYDLPNGRDRLVVTYDASIWKTAQAVVQLQNQDGAAKGCDAYFCTAIGTSADAQRSISPRFSVYEAGAKATASTNNPFASGAYIRMTNKLASWLTLNDFMNPPSGLEPPMGDGTAGVGPGQTATLFSAATYGNNDGPLVYNVTAEVLLTLQYRNTGSSGPNVTAGFNQASPFVVDGLQNPIITNGTYFYDLTIRRTS